MRRRGTTILHGLPARTGGHRGLPGWLCALLVSSLVVSCGSRASYPVCGAEPEEADVEAAKQAHGAAKRLFEKGRFERAIDLWRAAYELDCSAHGILINIAHAYENLENEAAARDAYDLYVERAGEAADPAIAASVAASAEPDAAETASTPPATGEAAAAPAKTSATPPPESPAAPR